MAAETITFGGNPVFRKKTHGEVISAELQEGLSHLGTAVAEAGRAAAEQLGPRVEAAREAAAPRLEAARGAAYEAVAPKVAAAVAAAAPAVASARETIAPRVEAARDAAAPKVAAAVTVAQAKAREAAADLGPRVEAARDAAQKALHDDVVPKLNAAQAAALAYAAPKVAAARESLAAGIESAVNELEVRREELNATSKKARKQAAKKRQELEKKAAKKRQELEKKATKTATKTKRKVGIEKEPRRWPWLLLVVGVGGAVVTVLRSRRKDDWTPAPAGDGPVPSYREDPVPGSAASTVSDAVSDAGDAAGDAQDGDVGTLPPQDAPAPEVPPGSPDAVADGSDSAEGDDRPDTRGLNPADPA
jgi:hypothetical protein